jgi:proline dehydrogenase
MPRNFWTRIKTSDQASRGTPVIKGSGTLSTANFMLRTLLLQLAKSARLRRWITSNRITRRLAQRFVPGEELSQAVEVAKSRNRAGMTVSLDHLGENVLTPEDAKRARDSYIHALDQIAAEGIDGNVSLKLTHLGLDLGDEFCAGQLRMVTQRAAQFGNFVRVDMEGSAYTERTLRIVKQARAENDSLGTVIQAYLYRSEKDIQDLLAMGCRIRLVKGAYKEPAQIAFPHKKEVNANFVKLMKLLLPSGIYHAIATHDPDMIDATVRFATERRIPNHQFEFQMLYGIRTDLQNRLARDGYRVRVYIPYGRDWFPYFMRRLAERPANLLFFAKSLFGK